MLKRKRCKQCGWELKFFSKQEFCSDGCTSLNDRIKREYEESRDVIRGRIEQQEQEINKYREALNKIATRKMSAYLNVSHMNEDFIKIANEALKNR